MSAQKTPVQKPVSRTFCTVKEFPIVDPYTGLKFVQHIPTEVSEITSFVQSQIDAGLLVEILDNQGASSETVA